MSNTKYGKVAVLMGGNSAERDVSLKSGNAVFAALTRKGIDAKTIDAKDNVVKTLLDGNFDRVFNMLHGRGGEDGVMQGCLEVMKLPYTGSGVLASALGMDKLRTKEVWKGRGLPTPDFVIIDSDADFAAVHAMGYPVIIKPVREGSSIGMAKVSSADKLEQAWLAARKFDDCVIAERWIEGKEYTASILGDEALPLIRLQPKGEFYDYHAKYISDETKYFCPCGLSDAEEKQVQELAMTAFRAVGAKGWGRIDIMRDHAGNAWLIEVNTLPGMTDHSLVPMAAKQAGYTFDDLVIRILDVSMQG